MKPEDTNHSIAIKDVSGEWIRRWVDFETYIYIRQLESAVKYRRFEGIEKLYKERFGR